MCYNSVNYFKKVGRVNPTPVNENGITKFKLSPEEREVVKLTKRMRQLEESNQKIIERLDNIK